MILLFLQCENGQCGGPEHMQSLTAYAQARKLTLTHPRPGCPGRGYYHSVSIGLSGYAAGSARRAYPGKPICTG